MVEYRYDKLRGKIVEKYGSQESFANALHLSTNSMSKKMTGKTGFSQEDITKWCSLLGIKQDEIGDYFFS